MRITDRGRTIELKDSDPVVRRIRALLFANDADPIATFWNECSNEQRAVLVAIATAREITQDQLEQALGGISGTDLRGRHIAIAKIAKRVGIDYPIRATGGRREYRRFSLEPGVARHVVRLQKTAATARKKR